MVVFGSFDFMSFGCSLMSCVVVRELARYAYIARSFHCCRFCSQEIIVGAFEACNDHCVSDSGVGG